MNDTSIDYRRPPGPVRPVALGVDPETLAALEALRERFGNIVSVEKPSGRIAYFVNEPEEVRRILVRRHGKYKKGPGFERVKMLLGNGIIVSDGDVWRRARTMIQPAFKVQNVHRLIPAMVACCDKRAAAWAAVADAGGTLDITAETSAFALELILVSIFGDDYESRIASLPENPFSFLASDSVRDLGVVMKARALRRFLSEIIAARRASDIDRRFDFLAMYLSATDRQGAGFTDEELLDELITLIVAGFETSANTLNWAWYLLAGHPGVEARLIEEAERLLPNAGAVNADSISAMVYTQQVIEETLRLYPPVWLFTRRALADDALDDYDVPRDADIYLSPYLLHRTEAFWEDPDRFDPDRFESSPERSQRERPYFPFSLGPRRCLGEYFSFLEMKIHLGLLLPRFRMLRLDDEDPGLELGINLRSKRNIRLRPERRVRQRHARPKSIRSKNVRSKNVRSKNLRSKNVR